MSDIPWEIHHPFTPDLTGRCTMAIDGRKCDMSDEHESHWWPFDTPETTNKVTSPWATHAKALEDTNAALIKQLSELTTLHSQTLASWQGALEEMDKVQAKLDTAEMTLEKLRIVAKLRG